MSHEEIAIGLGVSRGTLEKHFAHELSQGAYARRLEVLDAMHKAAVDGNVAAQKAYLAMDPQLAAPPLPKGEAAEKRSKAKGKKEQAQEDAGSAHLNDPEWARLLSKAPTRPQ